MAYLNHPLGHGFEGNGDEEIISFARETIRASIAIIEAADPVLTQHIKYQQAEKWKPSGACDLAQKLLSNKNVAWPVTIESDEESELHTYLNELVSIADRYLSLGICPPTANPQSLRYVLHALEGFRDPFAYFNSDGLVIQERSPIIQKRIGEKYEDLAFNHTDFVKNFQHLECASYWKMKMGNNRKDRALGLFYNDNKRNLLVNRYETVKGQDTEESSSEHDGTSPNEDKMDTAPMMLTQTNPQAVTQVVDEAKSKETFEAKRTDVIETFSRETIKVCIAIISEVNHCLDDRIKSTLTEQGRLWESDIEVATKLLQTTEQCKPISVKTKSLYWTFLNGLHTNAHKWSETYAEMQGRKWVFHSAIPALDRLPVYQDLTAVFDDNGVVLKERLPLTYKEPYHTGEVMKKGFFKPYYELKIAAITKQFLLEESEKVQRKTWEIAE